MTKKEIKMKTLMDWNLSGTSHGTYMSIKFEETHGITIDSVLEKMTSTQLDVILKLISASYSKGCCETREHIKSLKIALGKE